MVLARVTIGRVPLRHVQVNAEVKGKTRREFVHQEELPAVSSGKNHHACKLSSAIRHDLSQFADAQSASGHVVQGEKAFSLFDCALDDVGADLARLVIERGQDDAERHLWNQDVAGSLGQKSRVG